jgi:Zn-dependent M28 family amino/carboxypeptidase
MNSATTEHGWESSMMNLVRLLTGALLILYIPLSFSQSLQTPTGGARPKPAFSNLDEFKAEFKAVPCKGNSDRLKAVQALFEKLGAPAENISIEKTTHTKNIVIRKPGSSSEIIVIGAHYDKVDYGCGAVDNWTGIVTIAHIYKTIKDVPSKRTILFVGFGSEEEGLIGSQEMVKAINKDQLSSYCAMINIDSLGLSTPQAYTPISSKKLIALAGDLAKRMQIPFQQVSIRGADGDSSPFLERKIPAISLVGLSNDWSRVLHTNQDQPSRVDSSSVYAGYRLALALYGEIENSPCHAFR